MKGMSVLMAGVAAAALMVTAGTAMAAAAATDAAPASATPTTEELAARVDALEAELQDAEIRATADHDKVAGWKPLKGWWDDTKISGRMYYNFSYVDSDRNHVDGTGNGTSFEIKRFYVGIDHTFDKTFSANVTTDFTYDSTVGATQLYIKKAYLQAKLDDAFTVRLGSADLPWIPFAEGVYGYRYVENTIADRTKFGTSADWGIHMLGKFYDGLLDYQFSVVNGSGYKKTTRSKGMDFEGRVGLHYEGFTLGVGGYVGKLGAQKGTETHHTAGRFDAIAAYKYEGLNVGVEYFYAENYTQVTSQTASHATGVSPFVSYTFTPQWKVFGRYDYVKPYSDTARKDFKNNYYNIGVTYSPAKIVDFSLVYKHDGGSDGYFKTSNGTIGGDAFATGNDGNYNEFGLFGRLRW
jgi:hypothetical protein